MNRLGIFITFYGAFLCQSLTGYGYDIKALRKWHPDENCYYYWIGVCDFHDKTHTANTLQRKKIEEILPLHDPAYILILVEDLSSINDQGRLGCGPYCIQSRIGILAGLGNFCKDHMIPVHNVEFRYCRVVALGPVINNIHAPPATFATTKKMSLAHLVEEIEQAQADLLLNASDQLFRELLNQKLLTINTDIKKLNIRDQQKTIAEYLQETTTPLNRLDIVKTLLTFDGVLIGLKFVDATMRAPYKKKIIAFGGGTHINEAYEILQKVDGWEPIMPHETINTKGSSLVKSIGGIDGGGSYFGKPQPISLELLEHYLKN